MDPDLVFIVNYACPRCHADLEARASGPPSWLRCPGCGRASLPPDHSRPPRRSVKFLDDDAPIIGNFTTGGASASLPLRPRAMAPLPSPLAAKPPTARLVLGSGFFLSTILFVFSLLDSNRGLAGLFGLAAVASLIVLARQKSRPPSD